MTSAPVSSNYAGEALLALFMLGISLLTLWFVWTSNAPPPNQLHCSPPQTLYWDPLTHLANCAPGTITTTTNTRIR